MSGPTFSDSDIRKRIIARLDGIKGGYQVRHGIPGEAIVCYVPTLELASVIVMALRQRARVKRAEQVLSEHLARNEKTPRGLKQSIISKRR